MIDRINGLADVRSDIVILRTPEGDAKLELAKYRTPAYEGDDAPAPANAPGIRHILFLVDDIKESLANLQAHGGELVGELVNYEDIYWLCYVRGPAGSSSSWLRRSTDGRPTVQSGRTQQAAEGIRTLDLLHGN